MGETPMPRNKTLPLFANPQIGKLFRDGFCPLFLAAKHYGLLETKKRRTF